MDIQIKKGLLEICVLTVLKRSDSYGYQIVRDISQWIEISESTLYPILRRLELSQCLQTYSVEHNSRLRKYYKITEHGLNTIQEFLGEWNQVEAIIQFIKGDQTQ